jgi:hypothetical protein
MSQIEHPLECREFAVDGSVRRTLVLPLIDVFVQEIAGNLGCAERTEKWLEMEAPSTLGVGLGTLSIDFVVSQKVFGKLRDPHLLRSRPHEFARGDLRETVVEKSHGLPFV